MDNGNGTYSVVYTGAADNTTYAFTNLTVDGVTIHAAAYNATTPPSGNTTTIQVKSGSENYVSDIDNVTHTVTVPFGTTAGQLRQAIESTDGSGQSYTVKDSLNAAKTDATALVSGDKLEVSAANGSTKVDYSITVEASSNTSLKVKAGHEAVVTAIHNTEDPPYGTYWVEVAENTTVAQLKAALESTDGSVQTYRVYAASDNDHEKDDSSIITITTNPSSADKIIVYAAAGGWKTFKIFVP